MFNNFWNYNFLEYFVIKFYLYLSTVGRLKYNIVLNSLDFIIYFIIIILIYTYSHIIRRNPILNITKLNM